MQSRRLAAFFEGLNSCSSRGHLSGELRSCKVAQK